MFCFSVYLQAAHLARLGIAVFAGIHRVLAAYFAEVTSGLSTWLGDYIEVGGQTHRILSKLSFVALGREQFSQLQLGPALQNQRLPAL